MANILSSTNLARAALFTQAVLANIPHMVDLDEQYAHYRARLREAMKARGVTGEAMAEKIGAHPVTISKLLNGKIALDDEWRARFAAGLAMTQSELFGDAPLLSVRPEVRAADVKLPPVMAMPNDVPVLGTAAGSHVRGAFQLSTDPIDYVRRPPALLGAKDAYAIYVENVSMEPEHNHGDLRFAHPGRPARLGDSVIVQVQIGKNAPIEATIGRLRKRGESVIIEKLNPPATVTIKGETVLAVHKVLTMNELFGV